MADEIETLIEWFKEDRVRVIEQRIPPGASTGFHRHEEDYVVVPITNGKLVSRSKDGDSPVTMKLAVPRIMRAGREHEVVNESDSEVSSIEIQLLR